jgi:hypothetical protein
MNEATPKIVDHNTAKRRHYDKCTKVAIYDNTLIMTFAQLESYQDGPGAPMEEVLLVRGQVSVTIDEWRQLRDLVTEALNGSGVGEG